MKRLLLATLLLPLAGSAAALAAAKPSSSAAIPASALVEPAALARRLARKDGAGPLLLHVGFSELYKLGHIEGSRYVGPAKRPDGLARLRAFLKDLPKDAEIILYCGCCPWAKCPNVGPAYVELMRRGFTRVKVLKLRTNFGRDWTEAGFPAVAGS